MIGRTLSRYQVVERIGEGGMGAVYRARDERLARDVALKVLPPGRLANDAARQRFRREALALSQLNHPNIATIHDFDTAEGMDFLVMEYIPGITLDDQLSAGAMPEKEVVRVGIQCAQGLASAHDRNIVHADLKPANLRLTGDGRVKILDFGLSRLLEPVGDISLTQDSSAPHGPVGTLPYMAPEQLRNEKIGPRTDIYALGAVLYEMAAGRRPFPETHGPLLIDGILHHEPVAPRALNRRISPELERIILKSLDKEPERRYQTARELQVDLERLRVSTDTATQIAARREEMRRPWRPSGSTILALALIAVLAAGAAAWRFWPWPPTQPEGHIADRVRLITILPFRNIGRSTEFDYFGVGLADVLSAKLTNARFLELRLPRAADVAGPAPDPIEIGQKLGVDAVLTGSYQIEQGSLSLTYRLVDVRTGVQLAGDAVQDSFTNAIRVEHGLATAIVAALRVAASQEEGARLAAALTQQNEAFQAYLRSNYEMERFWRQPSAQQLARVQQNLEEALRIDPDFAFAHASLARLNWMAVYWGYAEARKALDAAERQANLAITQNPGFGEAYAVRALVEFQRGDLEKGRATLRESFARAPNNALVFYTAGVYYVRIGLADLAVAAFRRARELNPETVRREIGLAYRFTGDFARARAELESERKAHPGEPATAVTLILVLTELGNLAEARRVQSESLAALEEGPVAQAIAALLAVREGKKFPVANWIQRYRAAYWSDAGYAIHVAAIYSATRDTAQALRWLRRADELGLKNYPFLAANPLFENLRSTEEFRSFLEGLQRNWQAQKQREQQDPVIRGLAP